MPELSLLRAGGIGFAILTFLYRLSSYTSLGINRSDSLDGNVYLILRGIVPKKGDIAAIDGHSTPYSGSVPLLKRVVGFEGDPIILPRHIQNYSRKRQKLTATSETYVPKGHVFVLGDHARSFDSRYTEFGFPKAAHILGKAIRLW